MDHLPLPKDCDSLKIEIPYLSNEAPQYDGLDLPSFPSRHGYEMADPGLLTFKELNQKPAHQNAAFVQSWLYFGLLRAVLGESIWGKLVQQQDFIREPNVPDGRKLLTSHPLILLLKHRKAKQLTKQDRKPYSERLIVFEDPINLRFYPGPRFQERGEIRDVLRYAALQCEILDVDLQKEGEEVAWPEIMLSVRVLIDTLTHLSYMTTASYWYVKRWYAPFMHEQCETKVFPKSIRYALGTLLGIFMGFSISFHVFKALAVYFCFSVQLRSL